MMSSRQEDKAVTLEAESTTQKPDTSEQTRLVPKIIINGTGKDSHLEKNKKNEKKKQVPPVVVEAEGRSDDQKNQQGSYNTLFFLALCAIALLFVIVRSVLTIRFHVDPIDTDSTGAVLFGIEMHIHGNSRTAGAQLEAVSNRMDKLDRRFQAVSNRMDELDQRFQAVSNRMDELDQRFQAVSNCMDRLDHRFQRMDDALQILPQRVTGHQNEFHANPATAVVYFILAPCVIAAFYLLALYWASAVGLQGASKLEGRRGYVDNRPYY